MAKFKIGDRVRFIDDGSDTAAKPGAEAVVTSECDGTYIGVSWVRNELAGAQGDGGYYPSSFELISSAPTTPTLKPGARVRLLKDDEWSDDYKKGDVVTVAEIEIYFNDRLGDPRHIRFEDIELVETPPYEDDLAAIRAELAKRD